VEIDPAKLCAALKVGRIDVYAVPPEQALLRGRMSGQNDSFVATLGPGGSAAYLAALKAVRGDTIKKMNRKRAQFDSREGGLNFTVGPATGPAFSQLMNWTRRKCRETGQPPVWETPWVLDALERLCALQDDDCRALLFTDTVGGRLAAVQLLLQSGPVLHTWIIAHDEAFESYSPGVGLTRRVIEWAADNGYREVDLGFGDYRFKRQLTNHVRPLAFGFLGGPSLATAVRRMEYGVRRSLEAGRSPLLQRLPGKAMRRWDTCRGLGLTETLLRR
jgi:CelD/BcsL family acetyltransferase involved in cellulose biosynthesis